MSSGKTDGRQHLGAGQAQAGKNAFALISDPKHKALFDEKYFEALYEQKKAITASENKTSNTQRVVLLFLCISLVLPETQVALFGISGKLANLREILLVISAGIKFTAALANPQAATIDDFLEAHCLDVAKGDEKVLRALRMRFGLGGWADFELFKKMGNVHGRHWALFLIASLGFMIWGLIAFFGVMFFHVWAIVSVLLYPSFSLRVSILVVLFSLGADMWGWGSKFFYRADLQKDIAKLEDVKK